MDVKCPKCGAENWLDNQSRCLTCDAILRRCADCTGYDSSLEKCRTLNTEIDRYESQNPSLLSTSTNCPGYRCAQRVR